MALKIFCSHLFNPDEVLTIIKKSGCSKTVPFLGDGAVGIDLAVSETTIAQMVNPEIYLPTEVHSLLLSRRNGDEILRISGFQLVPGNKVKIIGLLSKEVTILTIDSKGLVISSSDENNPVLVFNEDVSISTTGDSYVRCCVGCYDRTERYVDGKMVTFLGSFGDTLNP